MVLPVNFHESRKPNVTESDRDWLESDISRLEEYESYDWEDIDPLTLGKPVKYIPDVGLVVEGDKDNV